MGILGDLIPLVLIGGGIYVLYMYQQQQTTGTTTTTTPYVDPGVTYTTPAGQVQCLDGSIVATLAECPKADDNSECANFKDSGEDEGEECTNECGKSGNAEDCNACEKACDKGYVHYYSTNDSQRCHNLAGDWDDVNECCSKGNTKGTGITICPEDDEDVPAPATVKLSSKGSGRAQPGSPPPRKPAPKGAVTLKKPQSRCANLTGNTKRACLGLPPIQTPKKLAKPPVHGTAKCAKLTGVTKCACLGIPPAKCNIATGTAKYAHSYYSSVPTYNPSTYFSITVAQSQIADLLLFFRVV